jgi:DNA-binding transcriptional ArsR family regulator
MSGSISDAARAARAARPIPATGSRSGRAAPEASAPLFAALGDETRLELVRRLSSGEPLSIARLSEGAHVTRQAISKHLRVLADAGLVRAVKQGRESRFQLQPERIDDARRSLDHISARWDAALERLKHLVED